MFNRSGTNSVAALGTAALLSFAPAPISYGQDQLSSPFSDDATINVDFSLKNIIDRHTSWKEIAVALWKQADTRSHKMLQQLLTDTNWDRQKEIGKEILTLVIPNSNPSLEEARTVALARDAAGLELSGSLEITWMNNLSFMISIHDGCPDRMTEISVEPHIVSNKEGTIFDRLFKPITIWAAPKEGAGTLVETFSDPDVVAGYGSYIIELNIEAVARNREMEGVSVRRIVSHRAQLKEGANNEDTSQGLSQAEMDLIAIENQIESNREATTLPPDAELLPNHPLLNAQFPVVSMQDQNGNNVFSDAVYFKGKQLTIIKVSFVGCPPCRRAEPQMEKIDQVPGIRGTTLVVQTTEKDLKDVIARFQKEMQGTNYQHPWYVTPTSESTSLKVTGFPTYFVVDWSGKVIEVRQGGNFPLDRAKSLNQKD